MQRSAEIGKSIMHPTNEIFATNTIYTLIKTPKEILHEIMDQIGKPKERSFSEIFLHAFEPCVYSVYLNNIIPP